MLRRLADALAGGDHVHSVILGSAINNDGAAKMGYTVPSVEGQSEVIAMAQEMAGFEPDSNTKDRAVGQPEQGHVAAAQVQAAALR